MTPVGESPEPAEQRPTDARAQDPLLSSEESTQQTVPRASQSQENEPTGPVKRTSTSTAPPEDSIPEAENDTIDSSGPSKEVDPLAVERLRGRLSAFEERLSVMTEQRDELRRRCDTLSNTNQTLRDRIDSLEAKREELSRENDELQTELSAVKEVSSNRESLSPMKALSQTSLFIRYDNQKATTLSHIEQDSGSVEDLRENISIEYHTEFDIDEVEIEGELYEPFLHGTAAFGFVRWLVTDVPFQIMETNHIAELGGIFNKLDDIDRVGCREMVQVESVDSSFEGTFDLVLRNTVGEPLFVADIHSSRQPTAAPRVQTMVEKATQVGKINPTLSGAFLITQSFFEPAALRAATEATTNGLFSWSGRRSYRKLTRKNGFHLSLVERRDESFHFDLPDI
jgi:FtsZ-binding cell division protein ZapB